MSERRPPPNDTPPKETPLIDPPRKEAPVREPSGQEAPPREAPPPADGDRNPRPVERVRKLKIGVRVVWWSAVVLTLAFGGAALWLGVGQRDPFGLVFLVLAGCCALAGYGTLVAFRRPSAS